MTVWIPVPLIFNARVLARTLARFVIEPDHRGVLFSAPAILLQDEWAYETPTGTMQCRWHQGSLDAAEPSLRCFQRTTDILWEYLFFLGKVLYYVMI